MADVRIGGAYLDMLARTRQFVGGLRRTGGALRRQQRAVNALKRDVRAFNRSARAMVKRLVSIRSAVGVLSGGAGLGLLVKRQSEYGASLVETSTRLGLTVEQLQLLRRTFEGEGVARQQSEIGIQRFARRLAEARVAIRRGQGETNEYARAFRALGFQAEDFGRNTYDALLQSADGFAAIQNAQDRILGGFKVFDSEGVALINILQEGREEVERQIESYRRLGLTLNEEADTLKEMNQAFIDIGNAIQVGFASAVARTNGELVEFARTLTEKLPVAFDAVIRVAATMSRNLDTVRHAAELFLAVFVLGRLNRISGGIRVLAIEFGILRGAIIAVTNIARALLRTFVLFAVAEGLIQLAKFFINLRKEIESLETSFGHVATVATAEFIEIMIRGFLALPGHITGIFAAILQGVVELFRVSGSLAIESFKAAFTDQTFKDLFTNELDKILAGTNQRIIASFKRVQTDPGDIGVAEFVAGSLGLTPEQIEAARAALGGAGRSTLQDFVENFKPSPPQEVLPFKSDLSANAGIVSGIDGVADSALGRQVASSRQLEDSVRRQVQQIRLRTELIGLEEPVRQRIEFRREQENRIAEEGLRLERLKADAASKAEAASRAYAQTVEIANDATIAAESALSAAITEGEQEAIEAANKRVEAIKLTNEATLEAASSQEAIALSAVGVAQEGVEAWRGQSEELLKLVEIYEGDLQRALEEYSKRQREVTRENEKIRRSAQAVGDAARAITGGLEEAVLGAKSLSEAFREVVRELARIALRAIIFKPFERFLEGALGNVFGGGGGGIPNRQFGGYAHGLTLVGETGAELVDFQRPGRVYPNDVVRDIVRGERGGGGDLTVVNEITIDSVDEGGVRRAIEDLAPVLTRSSIEGTLHLISRDVGRPSATRTAIRRALTRL